MLVRAVDALSTKPEHGKISTNTLLRAQLDVRILARRSIPTSGTVGKMDADRHALGRWIMGERTGAVGQGAFVVQKLGADRDLIRIVFEAAFETIETDA